jgi:hypothetical protein
MPLQLSHTSTYAIFSNTMPYTAHYTPMCTLIYTPIRTAHVKTLVKKGFPFAPISPQPIRSAAKGSISPGSFENVGQGALVPVQMGPLVSVSATNRD